MQTNRTFKTFKNLTTGRRLRTQKDIESHQNLKENFFNELADQMQTFMSSEELQFFDCRIAHQVQSIKRRLREPVSLNNMKSQPALRDNKKMEDTEDLPQGNSDLFSLRNSNKIRLSRGECKTSERSTRQSQGLEDWKMIHKKFKTQLLLAQKKVKKEVPKLPSELEDEQIQLVKQLKKLQRGNYYSKPKKQRYVTNKPRYQTFDSQVDLTNIPKEFFGDFSVNQHNKTTNPCRLKTEPDREPSLKMQCFRRSGIKRQSGTRYHRLY